jgi:hypothetical protein
MPTRTNPLLRLVGILFAVAAVFAPLWASQDGVTLLIALAFAFTFVATRLADQ